MERDHVIDIAKGLGEILVCIGHSKFKTYYEVKLIYQFHMPLFFILSGMMINIEKYSIFKFIKKKMETILFSYYTISFYSLFNSIVQNNNFNYKKYFFQTLQGKQEGKNY
jgi:fucose 4-O-acetylase-like acetyltransferase